MKDSDGDGLPDAYEKVELIRIVQILMEMDLQIIRR